MRTTSDHAVHEPHESPWLPHAITAGIQILIRAVPLDVAEEADQLLAAAEHLPHPALAAAARDHAGFLSELAAEHELLRRQVIVILREPRPSYYPRTDRRSERSAPGSAGSAGSAGQQHQLNQ